MQKIGFSWRRITVIYAVTLILMFAAILRIFSICCDERVKASAQQNAYRIKLSNMRYTVFDTDMRPITNSKSEVFAVVYPTPRAITAVSSLISETELISLKERLKSGMPSVVKLPKEIECDGVYCYTLFSDSAKDILCPQLLGYSDSTGHGVSGLQQAYDDELYAKEASVLISTDNSGELLFGAKAELIADLSCYNSGLVLTLDSSVQAVTENAMRDVVSGAAIVGEIESGKIRAMVSKPEFDISDIKAYLESENSPFLNRAVSAYNVGSAFKPVVAAALLENGRYIDYETVCSGSTVIDNHTFGCHKADGHGAVDLGKAIAQSCNVYFYTVCQLLGAENILGTASRFYFGKSIDIGGITAAAGSLPSLDTLKNSPTALANFSIGQGELLASPVAMLQLYSAIAGGGVYRTPTVIEGSAENGVKTEQKLCTPTRAFSKETAETLKEYLKNVLTEGTGRAALPDSVTAAGKTATAQTGWIKGGREIQHSWFCGFFPYENPRYAVIVMIEDTDKNGTAGSPIFKNIADGITLLGK